MKGLTEKNVILWSVGLAAVLIFIYWLVVVIFWHEGFFVVFAHGKHWLTQFYLGAGLGAAAGCISLCFLNRAPFLADLRHLFMTIIKEGRLSYWSMCLISALAGISEELLFRGCLQSVLGLWWTSFIFVALHGYFNPWRWGMSLYGCLMLLISVGLGLLYIHMGMVAAITAHTWVDIVILWGLAIKSKHRL